MPCDASSAERMLSRPSSGSFAAELLAAYPESRTTSELLRLYMGGVPRLWQEAQASLTGLAVCFVPSGTRSDLGQVLQGYNVVALLAHHAFDNEGVSAGIELGSGECLTIEDMSLIAPRVPSVIHLGVCRSACFIGPLKSRCSSVRVVASQGEQDPEFFLRSFIATVRHWRASEKDYIEAHMDIRNSVLTGLGVS